MHNTLLVSELRKLVTTEPAPSVLMFPTGIPPYISQACALKVIIEKIDVLVQYFKSQSSTLKEAIQKAIDNRIADSRNRSSSILWNILDKYKESVKNSLLSKLEEVKNK